MKPSADPKLLFSARASWRDGSQALHVLRRVARAGVFCCTTTCATGVRREDARWTGRSGCVALASAILFSPAAYENWVWGLQWVIFVPCLRPGRIPWQDRVRSFAGRSARRRSSIPWRCKLCQWNDPLAGVLPFWKEAIRLFAGRTAPRERHPANAVSLAYASSRGVVRFYFSGYVISRRIRR